MGNLTVFRATGVGVLAASSCWQISVATRKSTVHGELVSDGTAAFGGGVLLSLGKPGGLPVKGALEVAEGEPAPPVMEMSFMLPVLPASRLPDQCLLLSRTFFPHMSWSGFSPGARDGVGIWMLARQAETLLHGSGNKPKVAERKLLLYPVTAGTSGIRPAGRHTLLQAGLCVIRAHGGMGGLGQCCCFLTNQSRKMLLPAQPAQGPRTSCHPEPQAARHSQSITAVFEL